MSVLLIWIYFLGRVSAGSPSLANDTNDCINCDCRKIRTLYDIILSCVLTTFACTWVSLHPNVPASEETQAGQASGLRRIRKFILRDIPPFVVAILFPEYILGWAVRQRIVAAQLRRELNHGGTNYTIAQAFFVIMGGIHRRDSATIYPLHRNQVVLLLKSTATLKFPSEAEIQDRSKSDWLAKGLAVIQTLWFALQCLERASKKLPITELEIITLGYAMLNLGIYIAWWDKPSRIECPIIWQIASVQNEAPAETPELSRLVLWYIIGNQDTTYHLEDLKEVPIFYSGTPKTPSVSLAAIISFSLGTAFGAIHAVAWFFQFPNPTEQKLWRLSSLILIGLPLIGVLSAILIYAYTRTRGNQTSWSKWITRAIFGPINLFHPTIILIYLAVRFTTFYVALSSLRSVPSGTFVAVRWTSFIPHI